MKKRPVLPRRLLRLNSCLTHDDGQMLLDTHQMSDQRGLYDGRRSTPALDLLRNRLLLRESRCCRVAVEFLQGDPVVGADKIRSPSFWVVS
jgi:hypothetical protein